MQEDDQSRQMPIEQSGCIQQQDYHSLVESIPDLVVRYDLNLTRIYVNAAWENASGLSSKEVINVPMTQLIQNSNNSVNLDYFNKLRKAIETEEVQSIEFTWINARGEKLYLDYKIVPEFDVNGKMTSLLAIGHDITDLRKMGIEVEERLHFTAQLIDSIPIPLFYKDEQGRYLGCNHAFEEFIGYTQHEIIGKSVHELSPKELAETYFVADNALFDKPGVQTYETKMRSGNGEYKDVSFHKATFNKSDGQLGGLVGVIFDITERKRAEESLAASEQKFRRLAENSPDNIVRYDLQCRARYINPLMLKTIGAVPERIIGKTPIELGASGPEISAEYEGHIRQVLKSGESSDMELTFQHPNGKNSYHLIRFAAEWDSQGDITGVLAIGRDITELKKVESTLRIAATAFESQEGMVVTDAVGVILSINSSFTRITGYTADEVIGKNPNILKSGRQNQKFYADMWESINTAGFWEGEIWNRRKNGVIYPEYLTITAVKDGKGTVTNYVASLSDITRRIEAEKQALNLAFYDPLTGLPNRRLLQDRLSQTLASSVRTGRENGLLFIDLDNFKSINDTLGHDIGDQLLQEAANRIQHCIREGDTVARFGGDEFVVILNELNSLEIRAANQIESIVTKMLSLLRRPYQLFGQSFRITSSIGATLFGEQKVSIEEILKQADIAMYQAKKEGRNGLRFFDPEMQKSINARAQLDKDLRAAIEQHQFELYYQMHTDSSRVPLGAEALIRWNHPVRGLISPAEFISFAEETGIILLIDNWVLEEACHQLKEWERDELTRDLTLSVNISAKQFHQADFVERVKKALNHHGFKASLLRIELTETMLVDNIEETIVKMNEIKAAM